jgi:hypothetical protein
MPWMTVTATTWVIETSANRIKRADRVRARTLRRVVGIEPAASQ